MNVFGTVPFVRIFIPFIIGLLTALIYHFFLPVILLVFVAAVTFLVYVFISRNIFSGLKGALILGILFNLLFFLIGNWLVQWYSDENNPNHYTHAIRSADYVLIRLIEPPDENDKSQKALVCIEACHDSGRWVHTEGKAIAYFRLDSVPLQLRYGDYLIVTNKFLPVETAKNPDQFDYKKYLEERRIYAAAFFSKGNITELGENEINPFWEITYAARDLAINTYRKYLTTPREQAVAEALVIGYRNDVDAETLQSYTTTGVVHVLAVSGLHVGILYALLDQTFFFLNRKKKKGKLKPLLILGFIWMFAFITGLSGSVVRATVMFTFFTIGKLLNRYTSFTNILACSALFIIAIEPNMALDVGFQLSYFAVFGITSLYPYFNSMLDRENKFVDAIWKLTSVALAAQIAALPLALFYFHQFPLYFLLANIIVIPLSGVVLYLGIALVLLQFIHPLASVLGWLLEQSLWLMNEVIHRIEMAPYASIKTPAITFLQLVFIVICFAALCYFFIKKKKMALYFSLVSCLLFWCIQSFNTWKEYKTKTFTAYTVKNASVIELRNHCSVCVISKGIPDDYFMKTLQQHWQMHGLHLENWILLDTLTSPITDEEIGSRIDHSVLQFGNKMIRIIDDANQLNEFNLPETDLTVVCASNIQERFDFDRFNLSGTILFDGSLRAGVIQKDNNEKQTRIYSVMSSGAYVMNL